MSRNRQPYWLPSQSNKLYWLKSLTSLVRVCVFVAGRRASPCASVCVIICKCMCDCGARERRAAVTLDVEAPVEYDWEGRIVVVVHPDAFTALFPAAASASGSVGGDDGETGMVWG